ncbi:hypothetical protein I41_54840 [Lacipirellula limnantheis]|uniref:Uncharacterized protein n=1 Tax=Lacipirellula limnantheis TaxID=2528024 RepID=A0A517U6J6_9BACT|nr:hypothetical protein I41_54840 [Lacipirellula limnantheis]
MEYACPLRTRRGEWRPDNSIISHLENGRAARYSDRMSTSCATAAPTRHPPGEAHAAPGALPPPATSIAAALAMNRAGEHVVGGVADADAAFHFLTPRPLHAAAGSEPPPTKLSDQACRPTTARHTTSQLQPAQQLRPAVAQNASGDTTRHATALGVIKRLWEASPTPMPLTIPCRSSATKTLRGQSPSHSFCGNRAEEPPCRPCRLQQRDRRHPNLNPPNNFGLLSPKTHQATPRDSAWRQQAFVGCVSDADVAHHAMPQRRHQDASGSETPPTAFATSQPKTPCRPVVSPIPRSRHSNPWPRQPLRFLSPETRKATKIPAREFAREATTAVIAPLLPWATCRQSGSLFSPFKDNL